MIKSLNANDDFSKTTVTTSMQGVEVSVSERKKDSLALRLTVNSDKSFRGNVNETVLLNVKDVQRGDTTKTYLLSVKLSFDEILVTVPKKLVFSLEGDMLVGKLYLHSSRFELIDKQNNPNNKLLTAGTESQSDLFKTDFKILRPSLGTVTVTIPRDHAPRPEVVRIAIPSLSQSVTLPADFLSN